MNQHDTQKPAITQKIVSQSAQPALEEAAAEPQAAEAAVDRADPRQTPYSASQQARMLQRMQRTVGNAQVQRMLSQRNAAPVQRATRPMSAVQALILPVSAPVPAASTTATPERPPAAERAPVTVQRATSTSPVVANMTPIVQRAPIARNAVSDWMNKKAADAAKWAFEKAAGAAGVDPRPIMGLLNRAGSLLGQLIKNPAPFANTLVRGVGQGFRQFGSNISAHLQSGFGAWLFGTMGGAGISVPRDLSPSSVLSMVLQVLGVTPDHLKQRVAAQVGARNVQGVEQAVGVLSTAMKGGLGGLWSMLKDELGDLKALVVDGIKDWLISSVVKAAVTKIASMFNPATGIVAAILSIANVIKFLVQRAGQIRALFQSVTASVSALAQGNAQMLASKVEQTLARMVPLAIGLFSSLVGIGGVAGRVKEIIKRVQSRVQSAIDKMIKRVADKVKGLLGRAGTATRGADTPQPSPANDQQRLRQGVMDGVAAVNKLRGRKVTESVITPVLAGLKLRHRLGVLEPTTKNGYWAVHGEIRRMTQVTNVSATDAEKPAVERFAAQLSKADPHAQALLRETLEANNDKFKGKDWGAATLILQGLGKVRALFQKPLLLETAFGVAAHTNQVVPSLKKANAQLKSEGKGQAIANYSQEVTNRKASIHEGRGAYADALKELQEQIFDKSKKSTANSKLYEAFLKELVASPDKDHKRFKPHLLQKSTHPDGSIVLTFEYEDPSLKGVNFRVVLDDKKMIEQHKGSNLKFKSDVGIKPRGHLQDNDTHVTSMGMNRAHVIPCQFLGSGYNESRNVVSTSSHFNQRVMAAEEDKIKKDLIAFKATDFDLTVTVFWCEFADDKLIDAIKDAVNARPGIAPMDRQQIEQQLQQYTAKYVLQTSVDKLRRCKNVTYEGVMRKELADGTVKERVLNMYRTGPDLWLGTEG